MEIYVDISCGFYKINDGWETFFSADVIRQSGQVRAPDAVAGLPLLVRIV